MAVKDGEGQISRSIQSLLDQTFSDFELIIINDGSTDGTLSILEGFRDTRIRIYSQPNQGVAISANRGLSLARGRYIARQDHDDFSFPDRLKKQVAFLERSPEVYLLGTAAEIYNSEGPTGRCHDHPTQSEILAIELLFDNPFVHSSVMFRREVLEVVGYYNPDDEITPLDDYDFISRVASKFKVANLAERLVVYYESNKSLTSDFRLSGSPRDIELRQKKSRIMAMNISNILDEKKISDKLLFFANLYSQTPSLLKGSIVFQEIEDMLVDIFYKLNALFPQLSLNATYVKRLEHLTYCWYVNPGLASRFDLIKYKGKSLIRCIQIK